MRLWSLCATSRRVISAGSTAMLGGVLLMGVIAGCPNTDAQRTVGAPFNRPPVRNANQNDNGTAENGNANVNARPPATFDVSITDTDFVPETLAIHAGDRVVWRNNGQQMHTVTSGDPNTPPVGSLFASRPLSPGETFNFTFDQVGFVEYYDTLHADTMQDAIVIVQEP